MPERGGRRNLFDRAGRVAFTFIMMNVWAVTGLWTALAGKPGKNVWR